MGYKDITAGRRIAKLKAARFIESTKGSPGIELAFEFDTRRPLAVAILSRNPCLFLLFLREGWNVLFIAYDVYVVIFESLNSDCKNRCFF